MCDYATNELLRVIEKAKGASRNVHKYIKNATL